jgi:CDP-glucose 4,6-dehydratase
VEDLAVTVPDPRFWQGRSVLITGHTGFKGAWLTLMLTQLGARVTGLALPPPDGPSLFPLLAPGLALDHRIADLREASAVADVMRQAEPSIVLHLGAQALVPAGYQDPTGTFAVNLTGTVNVLEAMRGVAGMDAAVIVTTDKVYHNRNDGRRFQEDDKLGGDDPYSASKAAAEHAVACWRQSFGGQLPPMATARAGNVIGGGDFAPSRLIPDIVRSLLGQAELSLRYPDAVRPWQSVLDVLRGYLLLAEHLARKAPIPAVNFAPEVETDVTVTGLIDAFSHAFGAQLPWRQEDRVAPEAQQLALDPRLAMDRLGWRPRFGHARMIQDTADWYAAWRNGDDMAAHCARDVAEALS